MRLSCTRSHMWRDHHHGRWLGDKGYTIYIQTVWVSVHANASACKPSTIFLQLHHSSKTKLQTTHTISPTLNQWLVSQTSSHDPHIKPTNWNVKNWTQHCAFRIYIYIYIYIYSGSWNPDTYYRSAKPKSRRFTDAQIQDLCRFNILEDKKTCGFPVL